MHSLFLFYLGLFLILCVRQQSSSKISTEFPSMINEDASQWLTLPSRWRSQHLADLSSNEINRLFKQFEQLNENDILQSDTQAMEGISMEVFYEVTRLTRRTK